MQSSRTKNLFPVVYGLAFLVAAALSVVMLVTDKNLQTDFGTMSSGYYVHWYVVLGMAIIDLVGAGLLIAVRSRALVKVGVVGSGIFAVGLVAAVLTYAQVGFASPTDFANYLFGVTYYSGYIRYLYDALLAAYVGTCALGGVGLALTRAEAVSGAAPQNGQRATS